MKYRNVSDEDSHYIRRQTHLCIAYTKWNWNMIMILVAIICLILFIATFKYIYTVIYSKSCCLHVARNISNKRCYLFLHHSSYINISTKLCLHGVVKPTSVSPDTKPPPICQWMKILNNNLMYEVSYMWCR